MDICKTWHKEMHYNIDSIFHGRHLRSRVYALKNTHIYILGRLMKPITGQTFSHKAYFVTGSIGSMEARGLLKKAPLNILSGEV